MRPVISDFDPAAGAVTVDWIAMPPNPISGTFESRVLEADGAGAQWGKLTSSGGTNVSFETRSGDSPSTMSPYKAVGTDGAIQSPPGKLIQYKATLAGTADATPSLDDVTIAYTGGSTPTTTTSGAGASGTAAGSGGGTGTNPGGVSSVDTKAPVIGLASRRLLASASGKVKLRLSCPADETSCKLVVRLKDGRKTIALNSATLSGGKTSKVTLRLTRKARRKLAARGRLQLKAVVTARDAAGNRSKSKFSVTLRPR
jgi:hypothetical protein